MAKKKKISKNLASFLMSYDDIVKMSDDEFEFFLSQFIDKDTKRQLKQWWKDTQKIRYLKNGGNLDMFTKPKTETKNTISQEEYERRLKELQDEIEQLKKIKVEEPKKKGIWKPAPNEAYYTYYAGSSANARNTQTKLDEIRFEDFEYYKTPLEALYGGLTRRYTEMFRRYVEEHSKPLDWNCISTNKWFIKWSFYDGGNIIFDSNSKVKTQGAIYASSMEVLEDAIEFVGRDNVIKYVIVTIISTAISYVIVRLSEKRHLAFLKFVY